VGQNRAQRLISTAPVENPTRRHPHHRVRRAGRV